MKFLKIFVASCILLSLAASSSYAEAKKYVLVNNSFVIVYKDLDPKSMVLGQANKGEHLELIAEGDSWFKVKFKNGEGWLEKRSGIVVNNSGNNSTTGIIIILFLIAICATVIAMFVYKYKIKTIPE
jgi:uncharacterized protein YgiM (DUF1202 family)